VRDVKDALSRRILAAFQEHGLSIASSTFEITGLPELRITGAGERWEHAPDQPPA
jgi:hypothetical protein